MTKSLMSVHFYFNNSSIKCKIFTGLSLLKTSHKYNDSHNTMIPTLLYCHKEKGGIFQKHVLNTDSFSFCNRNLVFAYIVISVKEVFKNNV